MCKPGSASGGGATSGGLGLAVAVVGLAAAVSMATAFIGTVITAALITVFSLAAAGIVMLVVILRRTRSVVTWPMRTTLPAGAGRPAIPAHEPLAIEVPAPVPVRAGVPTGPGDLAMVVWPPPGPGSKELPGNGGAVGGQTPSTASSRPDRIAWTNC